MVDALLRPGEREQLLDEIEAELPLWLARAAIPSEDPVSELTDLLRFDGEDLLRVLAVHLCTNPIVQAFAEGLPTALRTPIPSTERPRDVSVAIRGPIDWPATVQVHAAGQAGTYVTRPRRRTFDTPEHRALGWAVRALAAAVDRASMGPSDGVREPDAETVAGRIAGIRRAVRLANRTEWLSTIPAQKPNARTRQRLRASRNGWVRTRLAPLVERLLLQDRTDPQQLGRILRERYFVPERNWLLYEVAVLIRIDRAFATASADHVRRSLFSAAGVVAVYRLHDGAEIRVRQQGWPAGSGTASRRQQTGRRHGLDVRASRPDLVIERSGPREDRVILELKASRSAGTLGSGLSQLLGYLHERPTLFDVQPAGWLVPLPWERLVDVAPDRAEPLWIVPADRVADALVDRFTTST